MCASDGLAPPLECRVAGLGGDLCTVHLHGGQTLAELRAAIQRGAGIDTDKQRIFHGVRELRSADVDVHEDLSRAAGQEPHVDLLVIRWGALQEVEAMEPEEVLSWVLKAPAEVSANRDVVLAAAAKEPRMLVRASNELRSNREFILEAVSLNGLVLGEAPGDILREEEFIFEALTRHQAALGGLVARCIWGDFDLEPEVVFRAVSEHGQALRHAPKLDQSRRDCVLVAVRRDGMALCHAEPALLQDREIVLAAVAQNGMAFRFAATELQDDLHVVLAALRQDRRVLRYIPSELRRHRDVRALTQAPKRVP